MQTLESLEETQEAASVTDTTVDYVESLSILESPTLRDHSMHHAVEVDDNTISNSLFLSCNQFDAESESTGINNFETAVSMEISNLSPTRRQENITTLCRTINVTDSHGRNSNVFSSELECTLMGNQRVQQRVELESCNDEFIVISNNISDQPAAIEPCSEILSCTELNNEIHLESGIQEIQAPHESSIQSLDVSESSC